MINQQQPLAVGQVGQIDMCTLLSRAWYSVAGVDRVVFQVTYPGVAWPTNAVIEFKISNDGVVWNSFATAVTLSAKGMTGILTISGCRFACAEVKTVGSGTSPIPFNVICNGRSK